MLQCISKHIWYVTAFLSKRDMRNSIDVVLTCFRFSIFFIRLCKIIMTNMDPYAYFCCSFIHKYDVFGFLEDVVASGIL